MLAERADKVSRKLLAFIYVAAYRTSPYGLSALRGSGRFRLRLDVLLIILIGCRRCLGEDIAIYYICDEQGVSA